MRVLIGTPIHACKDYCMERWLQNVAELRLKHPADLLLVDNSPGLDYAEKVKGYCDRLGITNYQMEHLEIPQGPVIISGRNEDIHERVARSREIIRREFIKNGHDVWFCWECDQIIPTNALDKLIKLMEAGDFSVVAHNGWGERDDELNFDFGVTLVKGNVLRKYGFLPEFGTDPDAPDGWYNAELWYKERIKKDGYRYVEICGLIDPVYHLHNR